MIMIIAQIMMIISQIMMIIAQIIMIIAQMMMILSVAIMWIMYSLHNLLGENYESDKVGFANLQMFDRLVKACKCLIVW